VRPPCQPRSAGTAISPACAPGHARRGEDKGQNAGPGVVSSSCNPVDLA
jgi:hypothetical protein